MPTANAVRYDTIWLRGSDYLVTSLNARFAAHVPELKLALDAGVPAYPDASRSDFYDVALPTGWVYIHIREDKRTVYLVALLSEPGHQSVNSTAQRRCPSKDSNLTTSFLRL